MVETRKCLRCKDTPGEYVARAFSYEGRSYPEVRKPCHSCDGVPDVPKPDCRAIFDSLKGKPLKGKNRLRSRRPDDAPSYYVWRMARFHGGADVTMPVGASLEIGGNPWKDELDALAGLVAIWAYGTDLAGPHRWARALGRLEADLPGLPDSAYSGGPVADEDKPLEEFAELI
jgi:hypothetical protein